jgi:ribonuclease P protein component
VGITVSRRVGNAVVRNRVRRRLRAALHDRLANLSGDLLVIARPPSAAATWADLCVALDDLLARATEAHPANV